MKCGRITYARTPVLSGNPRQQNSSAGICRRTTEATTFPPPSERGGGQPSTATIVAFKSDLEQAVRTLGERDPVLRTLIRQYGPPTFKPNRKHYESLVFSILTQQVSGAAARSIIGKLTTCFEGVPDPDALLATPDEVIRGCGVSSQKLKYLRSLAEHVMDGRLELQSLAGRSDEEVINQLTMVKGIGEWTAHMFLIFSLGRLDVLPVGDLGVRKGVGQVFEEPELPTPDRVREIAKERNWSPGCSVATWYMWRVLD